MVFIDLHDCVDKRHRLWEVECEEESMFLFVERREIVFNVVRTHFSKQKKRKEKEKLEAEERERKEKRRN